MMNSNKPAYKLTDKDFRQINRRSLFGFQLGWNYERMQASGYLYTILPQLRKIYGDGTPELKKMMKTHMIYKENLKLNLMNYLDQLMKNKK